MITEHETVLSWMQSGTSADFGVEHPPGPHGDRRETDEAYGAASDSSQLTERGREPNVQRGAAARPHSAEEVVAQAAEERKQAAEEREKLLAQAAEEREKLLAQAAEERKQAAEERKQAAEEREKLLAQAAEERKQAAEEREKLLAQAAEERKQAAEERKLAAEERKQAFSAAQQRGGRGLWRAAASVRDAQHELDLLAGHAAALVLEHVVDDALAQPLPLPQRRR